jgi:uncharacterized protein
LGLVTDAYGAWRGVLAALALGLLSAAAWAQDAPSGEAQPIPPLRARVTDLTGTLSPSERQALDAKLAAWEAKTSNQLAVLIVPTTQPETIEQYGIRIADAWKLGQKGKDNGVLFLIAKNDKRMRIDVGYGLEGNLTDVAAQRIIGDTVAPLFSNGQFAAGIDAGVERIMRIASGDEPPPKAEPRRRAPSHGIDFGTIALIFLVAVPAVGAVLRSMLGNVGGGLAGAGIAAGAVWLFVGSLVFAAIAAVIAFVLISFTGFGGRGGPGMWIPGGGGGWSGGGGGFSGGGGGFGGGGASGGWD